MSLSLQVSRISRETRIFGQLTHFNRRRNYLTHFFPRSCAYFYARFLQEIDNKLHLPTLKYRRLRGDMIEILKITHNIYDEAVSPDLSFYVTASTRGNNYKLV